MAHCAEESAKRSKMMSTMPYIVLAQHPGHLGRATLLELVDSQRVRRRLYLLDAESERVLATVHLKSESGITSGLQAPVST